MTQRRSIMLIVAGLIVIAALVARGLFSDQNDALDQELVESELELVSTYNYLKRNAEEMGVLTGYSMDRANAEMAFYCRQYQGQHLTRELTNLCHSFGY